MTLPAKHTPLGPWRVRANVLQDGHVDPITGPRCVIKPTEGKHCGLYLIAHTDEVLREGQPVIYDEITRRAAAIAKAEGRP